jgi:transcriptional regulator with XRE-family HTH domain
MSQAEFAEKIFITKGFLSSIEIEDRRVTGRISKLVAIVFGVREEWLNTGEGEMFSPGGKDLEIEEIVSLYKRLNPFFKKYFRRQLIDLVRYEEEARKSNG